MKKLLIISLIMMFCSGTGQLFSKIILESPANEAYIDGNSAELIWKLEGNRPSEMLGYKIYLENKGKVVRVENSVESRIFMNDLKKGESYIWKVKGMFTPGFNPEASRIGVVKHSVTHLNFRPEPNTSCNPLHTVQGGTKFSVLDSKRKWLKVKLDESGEIGWLYGTYLETTSSDPYVSDSSRFYTGGQPAVETEFQQAVIVSGPTDLSKVPSSSSKTLKFKEDYTLWCVLKAKAKSGNSGYYLGFVNDGKEYPDTVMIGNRSVRVKRWNPEALGNLKFQWGKLFARLEHKNFPSVSDMDDAYREKNGSYPWYTNVIPNGDREGTWRNSHFRKMKWSCDRMEYYEFPYYKPSFWERIRIFFGSQKKDPVWSCQAVCPAKGGTIRYNVKVSKVISEGNAEMITSNGEFSRPFDDAGKLLEEDYSGGIKNRVHRISYLGGTDNPLINGLFAYSAVPWLYGSGNIGRTHQTTRFVGFDCADLVMGAYQLNVDKRFKIKYGANYLAKSISKSKGYGYLDFVVRGALFNVNGSDEPRRALSDGIVDENGNEVVINVGSGRGDVKRGDLIFFDWNRDGKMDHTTVFYKDGKRAPGILSHDDLVLMAGHDGVHIVTLKREIKHDLPTRFFLRRFEKL